MLMVVSRRNRRSRGTLPLSFFWQARQILFLPATAQEIHSHEAFGLLLSGLLKIRAVVACPA